MQKIISWNVASVRARLPALLTFLQRESPDYVFLQEIKATDENFPFLELRAAGYHALISGQKSYNGVAILSRVPLTATASSLPGFEDQARFIQAEAPGGTTLICIYAPNGNPPEKDPEDTTRLMAKLNWYRALTTHINDLRSRGRAIILGGDFNVIERDEDVYNPDLFRASALMVPPVRLAYQALQDTGLNNMIRRFNPEPHTYSFWDFQGGAWPRGHGILLDAFLVSPEVEALSQSAPIYQDVRAWPKTSDHAPIGLTVCRDL